MECTNTKDPNYFHKVVDCQYACPAHTPVPEYIRLIARGRYTDAYLLNRESNVFPGILGRVCDRPCEPACRRGRVDEEPVAICRLKRVASDLKEDITDRLPKIPLKKNSKRIALIGAGPASLTVANDLMPLGYMVDLYDKEDKPGGAMRFQVPGFRLPASVLDEEINNILNFGIQTFFATEVNSLKAILAKDYDAVFVGTGAPVGKDLMLPGRKEASESIHVGLQFLANVSFGHKTRVAKKVVIIGGGNTAMDCCRTALRLGAEQVTVVAPEGYEQMLASSWEKEEAEEEGVNIKNHLLPFEFEVEGNKLVAVKFRELISCYNEAKQFAPVFDGDKIQTISCEEVILAIGQSTAYPFIEKDLGIAFEDDSQRKLKLDPLTLQSTHPKVFFGGDSAFGPKNIIWAVAHGHEAAISIHLFCSGQDIKKDRPPLGMKLVSQKMALNQWSYDNGFDDSSRHKVPAQPVSSRLASLSLEVEKGFDEKLGFEEARRCLNCDVQTVFTSQLCIECDGCVDICPVNCLSMTENGEEDDLRLRLNAPAPNTWQALFVDHLPQTARVMVKDENLCIHCGLCAERCPTGAWDMQQFYLNLPHAKDLPSVT